MSAGSNSLLLSGRPDAEQEPEEDQRGTDEGHAHPHQKEKWEKSETNRQESQRHDIGNNDVHQDHGQNGQERVSDLPLHVFSYLELRHMQRGVMYTMVATTTRTSECISPPQECIFILHTNLSSVNFHSPALSATLRARSVR